MKTFKQYFEESAEGMGNLYHNTGIVVLFNMLRDNAIRLTYSSAIESEEMKYKKHPFFLSTARVKFGKHAMGGNFKSDYFSQVMVNIDKAKLRKYGIKYEDWDYWGDNFKSLPSFREEEEVRIFSSDDRLAPLNKFVDSIHVFISKDNQEVNRYYLEKIAELQNSVNIPIYFYENPTAYKTQQTKLAVKDITSVLNAMAPVGAEDNEYFDARLNTNRARESGDFLIKTLLKIYNGQYDKNNEAPGPDKYTTERRIFDYLYSYDGLYSILSDFHGAMRNHPPAFKQWHKAMLKAGATNTKEFVKIIQKVTQEKYDPYGNLK